MGRIGGYFVRQHAINRKTGNDFSAAYTIAREGDGRVQMTFTSPIDPTLAIRHWVSAACAQELYEVQRKLEAADLAARRRRGDFAFFKVRRIEHGAAQEVCATCGDNGGNVDGEGNWVECPTCQERGEES